MLTHWSNSKDMVKKKTSVDVRIRVRQSVMSLAFRYLDSSSTYAHCISGASVQMSVSWQVQDSPSSLKNDSPTEIIRSLYKQFGPSEKKWHQINVIENIEMFCYQMNCQNRSAFSTFIVLGHFYYNSPLCVDPKL